MEGSLYTIELVTPDGRLLADISSKANDRSIVQSRNRPEEISWTVNLDVWEALCRDLDVTSDELVKTKSTEVRIKRQGTYICGGQVIYARPSLSLNGAAMSIRATGFLNLFDKRFTGTTASGTVDESFVAPRSTVILELIAQSQAMTNGDFGVVPGPSQAIGPNYTHNYDRTNIKEAIQDISRLKVGAVDHEFTYDKKINTYASIGSYRKDITFEYPGNIIDISMPIDATDMANEVIAIGTGDISNPPLILDDHDATSRTEYKLQQDIIRSNAVDNSDGGMTNAINAALDANSEPLQLPEITVRGNGEPFVTDYGIGDTILVRVNGYSAFAAVNGEWRIESRQINIDANDKETVKLTLSLPKSANRSTGGLRYRAENTLAIIRRNMRESR